MSNISDAPDAPEMPTPTTELARQASFERELSALLNSYSKENGSNTPDFILATYMNNCLENFNQTSRAREKWYGRELSIGNSGNTLL